MDTCHVFCAGYDIVGDMDGVMASFDKIIGLNRLMAIHLNDSMNPFNSRKDRHAPIGQGMIGLGGIMNFVNHPAICDLPMLLETPNELIGYKSEIETIKSLYAH
jgi:deoxyribonuclease-4